MNPKRIFLSIYVVLKEDGLWYDSCMGGSCVKGIPLCVEIAPDSTSPPDGKLNKAR